MRRTLFSVFSAPRRAKFAALLAIAGLLFWADRDGGLTPVGTVWGQSIDGSAVRSNIAVTRHNLSSSPPDRKSTSGNAVTTEGVVSGATDELCVFCHTPHAAQSGGERPLWNRKLPGGGTGNPHHVSGGYTA